MINQGKLNQLDDVEAKIVAWRHFALLRSSVIVTLAVVVA